MNKREIDAAVKAALKSGLWMLRRSDDGVSCSSDANGFKWAPVGKWTTARDWNKKAECGGGLHGNGPNTSPTECHWTNGTRLEFCEIENPFVYVGDKRGKVKCKRARILLVNKLPEGLTKFNGSLDLRGCTQLKSLGVLKEVAGFLDLRGSGVKDIPKDIKVVGNIIR